MLKFSPSIPYAFTEHGAIMAAGVLNTPLAIEVSVYVVRAFSQLREAIATHKSLADRLHSSNVGRMLGLKSSSTRSGS